MSESPTWVKAPDSPRLKSGRLHVWRLDLGLNPEQPPPPRHLLSADESHRADRFRDSFAAARFVIARSALRVILGKYLRIDPQSLELEYGTQGKPILASPHAWLSFNLSHSRELGLLAITGTGSIGVDVEQLSSRPKLSEIAHRLFSRKQLELMTLAHGDAWIKLFFENWTAREARLKAQGLGVFDREVGKNWQSLSIRHFQPHPDYIAAVAVTANPSPTTWDFFGYAGLPFQKGTGFADET